MTPPVLTTPAAMQIEDSCQKNGDAKCVQESCPARVGLMGNPSDGFHGKTLSFCVHNFAATVSISPTEGGEVLLVPHPVFDGAHFFSLEALSKHSEELGYITRSESSGGGGLRLLQATCKKFVSQCLTVGLTDKLRKGFRMKYDTTIPRMVGLSGSSAIIVAAYRALMKYYDVTMSDLQIVLEDFPQLILDIESEELGIAAGLQDRVIQTYGGMVFMDFSISPEDSSKSRYTRIKPALLPELYLVYNKDVGGDSGRVHANVKERWKSGDPTITNGMLRLGSLAESALECIQSGDKQSLAKLMNENFAIRRELYSDEVVGLKNILISEILRSKGLAAKFSGSGGAFVCINESGSGWLSETEEDECKSLLTPHGFVMIRIKEIPNAQER